MSHGKRSGRGARPAKVVPPEGTACDEIDENPYPGLRPFESNEAHLFFGRDGQSDALLEILEDRHFLAVIGTSGSGKSSLVRAGLLPSLRGGFTAAGSHWRIGVCRPGADPIGNMARELAAGDVLRLSDGSDSPDDVDLRKALLEAILRRSTQGLIEAVRQARLESAAHVLIVIDQFEEIFRFSSGRAGILTYDEAAEFVKLLLAAVAQTEVPIFVVLTMRSEFLGDCSKFRDLPEALNRAQYLVPRMTRDERREAIVGPAVVGGGQIAPRLVQKLLNDVGEDPAQLPILQHALMRTWEEWRRAGDPGQPIDLSHYESTGGIAQALSNHADEAYHRLKEKGLGELAELLFRGLTEKGPGGEGLRRPLSFGRILKITAANADDLKDVIDEFRCHGRSFLTPLCGTELSLNDVVDISHESLIPFWGKLREWLEAEAESRTTYLRVIDAARQHRKGRGGLWRNPELRNAIEWREVAKPNQAWADLYDPELRLALEFLERSQQEQVSEWVELKSDTQPARQTELRTAGMALETGIGLCLSGGGYRAMLFQVGALSRLYEAGLLKDARRISSVSGSSIAACLLGLKWSILSGDLTDFVREVVAPIRHLTERTLDVPNIMSGILLPGPGVDRLVTAYADYLYGDATLQDLPDNPRFVINATNVQSGTLWRFSKPYMGDYRVGLIQNPTVKLAVAAAASSAFLPVMSPLILDLDPGLFTPGTGQDLQREPYTTQVVLTDGGVYDNLGLETVWKRYATVLVSDAGGRMRAEPEPKTDWVQHGARMREIVDSELRSLRKRQLIDSYMEGTRAGAYWGIRTSIEDYGLSDPLPCPPERTIELADTPTRLKALPRDLQERLINWGYAACDAALRKHVRPELRRPTTFPYPAAGV